MAKNESKNFIFSYVVKDKKGKIVKGEISAPGEAMASTLLKRQGMTIVSIKKASGLTKTKKITPSDISVFTRQLATMMKAGVPLLQAFEIVGKGHSNPSVGKLVMDIKGNVEQGASLSASFANYPEHFDTLFVSLVEAGEAAGILDTILDRLAIYKEKSEKVKGQIKSALFYPTAVLAAAFLITAGLMIFVVPAFAEIFASFGAELPGPTQVVIAISNKFTQYWYMIFSFVGGFIFGMKQLFKRSKKARDKKDEIMLKAPIFGEIIEKAIVARWCRTLSTMFAAGVPLVDALDSVAGAAGNNVYYEATVKIQNDVSSGISLTNALQDLELFPNMMLQMVSIGEESGSLDGMLSKVAEIYEEEVDQQVAGLSSLMEPVIMVVIGGLVGGMIIALYLPIFKMGGAVK